MMDVLERFVWLSLRRQCPTFFGRSDRLALSASDAKTACLKLRELIDCIVVAPRVRPGDPIHFEVRGRLAALIQPDPGKVSVRALVPREGIIRNHRHDEPLFVLSMVA
jgi:hypothetical protein